MKIRDVRENKNLTTKKPIPLRNIKNIRRIIIHQTHKSTTARQDFHYLIQQDGTIKYLMDIELQLCSKDGIDICLIGKFEKQNPTQNQLNAAAELITYLLIPREITPNLKNLSQVIPHSQTCPGKTWPIWKGYLFGTKTSSQPEFLAEYVSQKVVLPHNGKLTFRITFKNTGKQTWRNSGENPVKLNVCWEGNTSSAKLWQEYQIPRGSSIFKNSSWLDDFCPALMQEKEVKTGQEATFLVTLSGNNLKPGKYIEDFGLAYGKEWIENLVNGNPAGKAHCWLEIEVV